MTAVAALLLAVQSAGAPAPSGVLSIAISGLRSERGTVRLCMTRHRAYFPDCSRDPEALSRSVAASRDTVEFDRVPLGEYAIAVIHDENKNRKLDTLFGIPREGFGFSRNPKLSFGAPRFENVVIRVGPGFSRTSVRVQYLL